MKRRKIAISMLLVFALTIMASMTSFAFTNKEFSFSFTTSGTQEGYTEPNQKTDLEEKAYVTTTGGTVSTAAPVYFRVYRTNFYTSAVTYSKYTTGNNVAMTIDYTTDPILDNWYQLHCKTYGYTVSVQGRWCP